MFKTIDKIPMAKRFFPGLLPIIGEEKYKQVMAGYRELFEKHELPKNHALQWHLIEGILPGLAFYRVLMEAGESHESALVIIGQIFETLFSDDLARMKKLGRLKFIYPFLRLYIKPAMRKYPTEGWKIEWLKNDKDAIRFDMRSCYYHDTFSKYGTPELTVSFC
jgi:hypothetical protein